MVKRNRSRPDQDHTVLGLMSGTSLDGLDLAVCFFPAGHPERFRIRRARTVDYPRPLRDALLAAHGLPAQDLALLENRLTAFWAEAVGALSGERPDFIACSGHTVFHQPDQGMTLQIGNGAMLAAHAGIPVVCDFRRGDVARGGQGAPLVPMADPVLFPGYNAWLNLGGIANVTLRNHDESITAFNLEPV